jgi:DNA-directed RNA polymerase subunit M/transcription elongation factor TFIIS
LFDDAKKTDDKFLNNITCKLEPVSGIHKCKCGCDKVYSYELQTRSADEGMTVFLQCYECGKKWRY